LGALQAAQQRQRQVTLQMALVKLVEHHGGRTLERGSESRRRVSTPSVRKRNRVRGRDLFEPDLVTDGAATASPRSAATKRAARRAARRRGSSTSTSPSKSWSRAAAREWSSPPGRSFQNQVLSGTQVVEDFGNEGVDGRRKQFHYGRNSAMFVSSCGLRPVGVILEEFLEDVGSFAPLAAAQVDLGQQKLGMGEVGRIDLARSLEILLARSIRPSPK